MSVFGVKSNTENTQFMKKHEGITKKIDGKVDWLRNNDEGVKETKTKLVRIKVQHGAGHKFTLDASV